MKKLFTLILVLAGFVNTASAVNLFLDPGVWSTDNADFYVYFVKNETEPVWQKFTTFDNVYGALIPDGVTKVDLYRSAPNTTPTFDSYWNRFENIDISNNAGPYVAITNWNSYSVGYWQGWVLTGNRHVTSNYEEWNTTSSNNGMTASSDHKTFTRTVTGKALKAGTYSYKFVLGNDWRGNADGSNFTVTIGEEGVYDLEFSYNQFTNAQSCTVTKTGNGPVEYKYYVKEAEGNAITGNDWEGNLMTISGSKATLSVEKAVESGTTYKFKIVEEVWSNGTKENTYEASKPGDGDGYWSFTPSASNTYTVTFTYDIPSNFDFTENNVYATTSPVSNAYYFIIDDGGWKLGEKFTESHTGVWEGAISNHAGKFFALIPGSSVEAWQGGNWTNVIRPNSGSDVTIEFENYKDQNINNNSGKVWKVAEGFDGSIAFKYDSKVSQWSATPSFTRTITEAGIATFSSKYAVAIPEGVTASYVTGVSNGVLTTVAFTNGIPANTGTLLEGRSDIYTFTPATSTDVVSDNKLVAVSADATVQQTDGNKTNYILTTNNGESDYARFYKVNRDGNAVTAGKAYLQLPTAAAREFFSIWDEANRIDAVAQEQQLDGQAYNLAGQRVAQPTKGLYIVNGKKVIKK